MKLLRLCSLLFLLGSSYFSWAQTKPVQKAPPTSHQLFQGVWAPNEDENALFYVKGKFLYYTDFQETPVRYTITPTALTVYNDGVPSVSRVKKLTKDSLVYVTEDGFVTRLYRRRK